MTLPKVLAHISRVNFTMSSGERVFFDHNGDPTATYELVNWQRDKQGETVFVTVGNYDASLPEGHQFTMNGLNITWAADQSEVRSLDNMKMNLRFPGIDALLNIYVMTVSE